LRRVGPRVNPPEFILPQMQQRADQLPA